MYVVDISVAIVIDTRLPVKLRLVYPHIDSEVGMRVVDLPVHYRNNYIALAGFDLPCFFKIDVGTIGRGIMPLVIIERVIDCCRRLCFHSIL